MTANILALGAPIVDYGSVVAAVRVTFTKLAMQAFPEARKVYVEIDTKGGSTARVTWRGEPTGLLQIDLSMPSLPAFFRVPRAYAERLVGYLIHELQHVRKSDVDGLKGKAPLLANLINGLEDCRIEAEAIADGTIPNACKILSDLAQALLAEALAAGWTLDSLGALPFGAAILGRHALGHDLQLAGLRVGSQFEPALALMRQRLGRCKSTSDIAALASDMLDMAREAVAEQPKIDLGKPAGDTKSDAQDGNAQDGNAQDGDAQDGDAQDGDAQDGDAQDGDAQDGDAQDGDAQDGDAQDGDAQDGDAQDGDAQDGDAQDGNAQDGDAQDGDAQDGDAPKPKLKPKRQRKDATNERSTQSADHETALKNLIEAIGERNDITAKRLRQIPDNIRDWQGLPDKALSVYDTTAEDGELSVSQAHAMVPDATMLREHVRRLLKAPAQAMRQHYRPFGRLDRRAFPRMDYGAQNVFTKKTRADAVNTAVGLLLDNSGSMGCATSSMTRHTCQRALAIVLAEACKHADVDCHISTFASYNSGLATVKNWNTPLAAALDTIGKLNCNGGSTPLAACMQAAVDKLATRTNRTKRILIVLTDGDADEGQPALDLAQDYARSRGVHVIGVQIGSDTADAFRVGIPVVDPSKLSKEVLGALLGELRKAWAAR